MRMKKEISEPNPNNKLRAPNNLEEEQNISLEEILGPRCARDDAMLLIQKDWNTYQTFQNFPISYQDMILDFLQGTHGIQMIYDGVFKYVMNPQKHPERLESFLSKRLAMLFPESEAAATHPIWLCANTIVYTDSKGKNFLIKT